LWRGGGAYWGAEWRGNGTKSSKRKHEWKATLYKKSMVVETFLPPDSQKIKKFE
jgi:hypothetical protein